MSEAGRIVEYEVDAYTLKLEMTSWPFGSAVNKKDDSAIAASMAIKQDDMKANPLFTRAYRLCIPVQASSAYVVEVEDSGTPRDLAVWGTAAAGGRLSPQPSCWVPSLTMTEAYVAHRIIRKLAHWGVWAFFTRFQVINGENMPDGGPVILWVSS